METWKYGQNTFLSLTAESYKLMNILLSDHVARMIATQGADSDFMAIVSRNAPIKIAWDTAYQAWIAIRGTYKGKTQAWEMKLADLSTLRIKQWDITIQGTFLEGTGEYTQLLPNGRAPFQSGAYDLRLAEVKALQNRLLTVSPAVPALTTLAATIGTYHAEMKTLRDSQQGAEQQVDSLSTLLEIQRLAAATVMYKNLGRLMEKFSDMPVRIEDYYDMNYIRDGAAAPPEDVPPPVIPPVP